MAPALRMTRSVSYQLKTLLLTTTHTSDRSKRSYHFFSKIIGQRSICGSTIHLGVVFYAKAATEPCWARSLHRQQR
ncbi:uncharacterized protein EKO05_0005894 [Ascochyta rabiei]|uniref:uncharacterized protein n=1 Tax=Didymella rabiei TaxID=5454 RepID=UPI00220A98F8|nr:uncharacterized protein EKO05_0005894 [Ascochyta rabiei]UPX15448.1 hypothetical protein EKO05_0005894 [Ascochyta rabiei]